MSHSSRLTDYRSRRISPVDNQAYIAQQIRKYVPQGTKIFLFGSRVTGVVSIRSDYDIWLLAPDQRRLPGHIMAHIHEEMEYIPLLIDVVDFATVTDRFKAYVYTEGTLIL